MLTDLRYALRVLRRSPAFTAVAVTTLGLGVGLGTAIFSLLRGVLLSPLPFSRPQELVMVWETAERGGASELRSASLPDVEDWRDRTRSFASLSAVGEGAVALVHGERPWRENARWVSPEYLQVFEVEPVVGRPFTEADDRPGAPPVALLGWELWQKDWSGDRTAPGSTVEVDGVPVTVVGVLPRGFAGRDGEAQVFLPLHSLSVLRPERFSERYFTARGVRWLSVVGRLAPGVPIEVAQGELTAVARQLATDHPDTNADRSAAVAPLAEELLGTVRRSSLVLASGVALLVLIVCANVAALVLGRAADRRREVAVRASLGATRSQLGRQLVVEGLLLGLLSGALGLVVGIWSTDLLAATAPLELPPWVVLRFDHSIFAFTLLLATGAGALLGALPALGAGRVEVQSAMRGGPGEAGRTPRHRGRRILVAAEVALAVVLLVAAGLLVRTFLAQEAIETGFEAAGRLGLRVALPQTLYDRAAAAAFAHRLEERVRALPGVRQVAVASELPLDADYRAVVVRAEEAGGGAVVRTYWHSVGPGYFRTLGIPLRRGRGFTVADDATAPKVAVVSGELARALWPGQEAVGRRLEGGFRVVGVVGEVRQRVLVPDHDEVPEDPDLYLPFAQRPQSQVALVVRHDAATSGLGPSLLAAVQELEPALPVFDLGPLDARVEAETALSRFSSRLVTSSGLLALLLAAVGVYGVLAWAVTRRRREIGVRIALGARRGQIVRQVVSEGLRLAAAGAAAGVVVALLLTRTLRGVLYGVAPTDLLTFGMVLSVLTVAAVVAAVLPARRAATIDPMQVLRTE